MYLSALDHRNIDRNKPLYKRAEALTGVPWRLIAAIHYRENGLRHQVGRPGSCMQFDPPLTAKQERAFAERCGIKPMQTAADPGFAFICAALFLQDKMKAHGHEPLTPGAGLRFQWLAAFYYNGTGYGTPEKSPYVSNDPQGGVQLRITGTLRTASGGVERVDRPDPRPGVKAVMAEIRRLHP